jgi:hypothetical protein
MGGKAQPSRSAAPEEQPSPLNESQKASVLRALEDIRKSNAFRTRKRCQQFLSYIVERTLEGQGELLKERTLGVELYQRMPTYLTGEDSVVRVEAGEVRRRLAQYYTTEAQSPEVRIEIPLGSYTPEFHWNHSEAHPPETKKAAFPATVVSHLLAISLTVLVMSGVFALILTHKPVHPPSVVDEFWAPLLKTPQSVLICLASPVVYIPSDDLYKRYARTYPEKYRAILETRGGPLDFNPNDTMQWKDMTPNDDTFAWIHDSFVAAQMAVIFDRIGKPSQMRSLNGLSFQDLRNSPAVLIGAFNNRWTLQMAANLPFSFVKKGASQTIRELAPKGRVWQTQYNAKGGLTLDYAVVSRVFDSKTGQPLIIVGGIGPPGTEATGEFLSHPDYLTNVLRSAPPGWQKMNFQAVLQTDVTDGIAGPPKVVATRFW